MSPARIAGLVVLAPLLVRVVHRIEAIPCGAYSVMLILGGYRAFPRDGESGTVHIGREPVEITVPAERLGALRLRPASYEPEKRGSSLEVHTRRVQGTPSARFVFTSPPYLVHGLYAGTYELEIRSRDREGAEQEMHCTGLLATCIQHEIEHLNGVLFIDHLSRLKRDRVVKKFSKSARREKAEA